MSDRYRVEVDIDGRYHLWEDNLYNIHATSCRVFINGDFMFKLNGLCYLIRHGKNLLESKNAKDCFSYENYAYQWVDFSGYYHLAIDRIDLLENKKIKRIRWFGGKIYFAIDENKNEYIIDDFEIKLMDKDKILQHGFENDDYSYREKNGNFRLIRNGKDLLKNKKAFSCRSFKNNNYDWLDKNGKWHKVKEKKKMRGEV